MNLELVGWNTRWQQHFTPYGTHDLLPGRVVGEHRNYYRVATEVAELTAVAPGRARNAAAQRSDLAGVGDFVALRLAGGDSPATIEAVLPRTSALVRKASGKTSPQLLAANIDVAFIVTAMDGDFNLQRLERYLALVRESGATPVIVLNKADLAKNNRATDQLVEIAADVPVHFVSALSGNAVFELERYFDRNRTVGLFGSSGVGKSTLTNLLLGQAVQATQEVRGHDRRGRHTTTHRQLFVRCKGGAIIDTPGMRGLELWNAPSGVDDNFADIAVLATECRFSNCGHDSEPACAVKKAVAEGRLDAGHLASYVELARAQRRR